MFKILIVEDENNARKILRKFIESIEKPIKVYEAACGVEAKKLVADNEFQLIFLDIKLPDISGLDIAKHIRSIPRYRLTNIVMLTSMIYFQQEAFKKYHVYDFIEKPYEKNDITKVVYEIIEGLEEITDSSECASVKIQNKEGSYKIRINQLLYVESIGRKKVFHTVDFSVEVPRMTMDQVYDLLSKDRFIQVHKSYLVNIHKIDSVNQLHRGAWDVHLENGDKIPVSEKYKDALESVFMKSGE